MDSSDRKTLDGDLHNFNEDDGASSSTSSSSENEEDNVKFSLPSNVMFLLGSSCYVALAVSDLRRNLKWGDDDYYYYEYYYSDEFKKHRFSVYNFLSRIGSILLVTNAGFDLYGCIHIAKKLGISIFDAELKGDSLAAILFGCAAMVDLRGALPGASGEAGGMNGIMYLFSSHLYLFSAFSTLSTMKFECSSLPVTFGIVGDILFLVGSFIDVFISYISDPDIIHETQIVLLRFSLLSSVLWLTDAFLYLSSNLILLKRRKANESEVFEGQMITDVLIV